MKALRVFVQRYAASCGGAAAASELKMLTIRNSGYILGTAVIRCLWAFYQPMNPQNQRCLLGISSLLLLLVGNALGSMHRGVHLYGGSVHTASEASAPWCCECSAHTRVKSAGNDIDPPDPVHHDSGECGICKTMSISRAAILPGLCQIIGRPEFCREVAHALGFEPPLPLCRGCECRGPPAVAFA